MRVLRTAGALVVTFLLAVGLSAITSVDGGILTATAQPGAALEVAGQEAVSRWTVDKPGRRVGQTTVPGGDSTTTLQSPTTLAVATTLATTTTTAQATTTTLAATTTTVAATTTTLAATTTTAPATTTTTRAATTTTAAAPAGSVNVAPGTDLVALVNSKPAGTAFLILTGTHRVTSRIYPKDGMTFLGQAGAILTGSDSTDIAFGGGAKNVTIKGLVIERFKNPAQFGAIHTGGSHWLIEGNEFRYNAGGGVAISPGFRIIGNYIHHNEQIGIIGSGSDVLVEGNEIAYNNPNDRYEMGWEAGGAKFVKTTNLVVRNNYVHDNHGPGLWTDGNNYNTLYEGNVVLNNYGPGIFHEISYDAVIRNNRSEGNAFRFYVGGILVANSPNVEVYGNTVAGNDGGVAAIQDARGSGDRGAYNLQNLWVHDNVVTQAAGWSGVRVNSSDTAAYSTWNNRFDRNTYSVGTQTRPFFWQGAERTRQEWVAYGQDLASVWK
jgi:parallel beta-helix repeat protein